MLIGCMAEQPHTEVQPLGFAAPPPPPRNASARRVFMYLLPAAICVGAYIGSSMIEETYPKGDSRNFQGPLCVIVMAPLGVIVGVMRIREAFRPRGLRALLWGVGWNVVAAFGPWLALWVVVRFGLLKHT
jgi:hypothetical protein